MLCRFRAVRGKKKSVNVNRRPHVSSFTSKHKSWHDDGKFDARLTARAIDHSHVDQSPSANDRRTITAANCSQSIIAIRERAICRIAGVGSGEL